MAPTPRRAGRSCRLCCRSGCCQPPPCSMRPARPSNSREVPDMSIYVDENTKVVVQGLTGGQGRFHGLRNKAYGTKVVAGVTPGKGGQDVEGIPIFDTVAEAVEATGANASFVSVPPKGASGAILEAAA